MEGDILIDKYLKGLLSKDEEKLFLERLESDIAFNEKFKFEKQLYNALNDEQWSFFENASIEVSTYKKLLEEDDLQNLKKTLIKTNAEFNSKENKSTKRIYYYIAAASVVLFLGFQFFFNQGVSNQELYNDYLGLSDLPSFVTRGNETNDLAKALDLFEDKKYEDALVIFQSTEDSSENEANLTIYKGIAQTELGKYDQAEQNYNNLINSDLLDAEKGYWYKALLFLKADRVEDVKSILKDIVSKSLYNKDKAESLLNDLE